RRGRSRRTRPRTGPEPTGKSEEQRAPSGRRLPLLPSREERAGVRRAVRVWRASDFGLPGSNFGKPITKSAGGFDKSYRQKFPTRVWGKKFHTHDRELGQRSVVGGLLRGDGEAFLILIAVHENALFLVGLEQKVGGRGKNPLDRGELLRHERRD